MTREERLRKHRERLAELKLHEAELHEAGYRYIAGVDEAGRGPLAGPVAAAVVCRRIFGALGVDDFQETLRKKA